MKREQDIKIVIGGDVCPIRRAEPLFTAGKSRAVFNDLMTVFQQSDLNIVNLECCLIKEKTPIVKDGPAFGAPVETIAGIKKSHIHAVNLANNHSMDHGNRGLEQTIETCRKNGIGSFGAGKTLSQASKLWVKDVDGVKIGFIGIAEHEFSIVTPKNWGANPFNPYHFATQMQQDRSSIDFLIVLFHGGKEYYPYPTPKLVERCRFMIDLGADAVICQHSHVAGCIEWYQNRPVIYGQGNLVFDRPRPPEGWHEGFLVKLSIDKVTHEQPGCSLEMIPYVQFLETPEVIRLTGKEKAAFEKRIIRRSEEIQQEKVLDEKWLSFCKVHKQDYMSRLHGYGRILRVLNRTFHFTDWLYTVEKKNMLRNVVECETHREVLETIWRNKL